MPQLDPMLRALVERGANELVLAAGARPAFRFENGLRPVSRVVLHREQILALLRELTGPETIARLEGGDVPVECRGPEGWRFRCVTEGDDGSFVARIAPRNGATRAREVATQAAPKTPTAPRMPSAPPEPTAPPERAARPEPTAPPVPSAPQTPHAPQEPTAPPEPPRTSTGAAAIGEATGPISSMDALLRELVERGGSDLHVSAGERPMIRLHGDMARLDGRTVLSPEDTERLAGEILPPRNAEEFAETGDTDFAHEIPGVSRFRVNVFRDRKGVGTVVRVIPTEILTAEQLGLPKPVLDLCMLRKGLVVVTGPTGSGKSTTLAAMIDHLNERRNDHIITIEDPIEFVHPNKGCLVNQREVGIHTRGFKPALRAALREDPDVVLVGEMRDLETIEIAIETAETGHLVFGTLHTTTAASTVDRVIDQFPADRQEQIRAMLSESLKGVIAQTLLRRVSGGRVAAMEILIGIPAISNLIREGKTFQIPSIMQTGKKHGMMLLNDALMELVKSKQVAPDEAYAKATDKAGLAGMLRAAGFVLSPSTV